MENLNPNQNPNNENRDPDPDIEPEQIREYTSGSDSEFEQPISEQGRNQYESEEEEEEEDPPELEVPIPQYIEPPADQRINMFNPQRLQDILNQLQQLQQPPANPENPDEPVVDQPVHAAQNLINILNAPPIPGGVGGAGGMGNVMNLVDMMLARNPFETEEDIMNREICDSHMIDYIKKVRVSISEDEEDNSELYKEEFKYDSITKNLAKMVVAYWQEKGELPTDVGKIDDLVEYCCQYQYRNRPCGCLLDNWQDEEMKKVIYEITKRYILFFGDYPSCGAMSNMLRYQLINKRLPTMEELGEYLKHRRDFQNDPEQYFQDHKHQLPTANLSLLKPTIYEDEETKTCGLCYNEIGKGTEILKLPCRGEHVFHTDEKECLEGLTITEWLKSNKVCPMCKDEIIIEDENEKN